MTDPTRRNVLRGAAAVAAAGGLAGAGVGAGPASAVPHPTPARHFPFLEGAFKPVTEELTAFDLPVTGRVPRELNGRYLRTGPNVLGLEDPRAHHWMLGEGMVHGVRLREGRAEWYRNRWVRSSQVAKKLGEPYPGPVPPDDFPCNTHVIPHRGRILALQESGPLPYELDDELNTVGTYDFRGTLEGAFTAHTKYDVHAGELHAIAYYPTWDHVRHLVVDPAGRVSRSTRIPVADAPMIHDFALTENHVVILDMPVTFDPAGAERGDIVPYVWNDRHPARVGVLPRAGGAVRWFEVDPVYYSHTLNAYEEGPNLVIDMTNFDAPFLVAGNGSGGPYGAGTPGLTAGRSTCVRGGYGPGPSTTARRNSRASTRRWCPAGTVTATRRRPRRWCWPIRRSTATRPTERSATRSSSTTCCAAPRRCTGCPGARRRARPCSCRPTPATSGPPRTTGTRSRMCTTPIAGPRTW